MIDTMFKFKQERYSQRLHIQADIAWFQFYNNCTYFYEVYNQISSADPVDDADAVDWISFSILASFVINVSHIAWGRIIRLPLLSSSISTENTHTDTDVQVFKP